jgi:asparagine synthase (glutamine-hydrolysing)
MCGIFALLNYENLSKKNIMNEFEKGKKRGPEFSKLDFSFMKMALGFHRLAINGLNNESNQPLIINDIVLLCNGEIYNYKQLYSYIGVTPTTGSDCEVIIHLFIKYGIEQTITMLDGEFSFILYDNRLSPNLNNQVYIVRDPLGVRPLYYFKNNICNSTTLYGFASELKCLTDIYNFDSEQPTIDQFTPGTYSIFNMTNKINSNWVPVSENIRYFLPSFSYSWMINDTTSPVFIENMFPKIANYLNAAVNKRCLTTERPIACLLSGGLDSSLVTALVNYFYETHNLPKKLETYSIGLVGSEDLKYAKIVADYLNTKHTEVIVTEKYLIERK